MKLLKCIIQPHKLEQVKDALNNLGIKGMTVSEVKGYGRQRGHKEIYRGLEYNIFFLPKIMIEVAIDDELVDEAVKVVVDNARTGHIGDGKIFVSDLANAIRIRTGEEGTDAL
jgi:nitrogen regulatory protein PII